MVTLTITETETGTVVDDPEEALLQLLSNLSMKTKAEIKVSLKEIDNALQHSSSTEKNSLQQMASLLQLLSPLEYHNVAKQAMVVHLVDESKFFCQYILGLLVKFVGNAIFSFLVFVFDFCCVCDTEE